MGLACEAEALSSGMAVRTELATRAQGNDACDAASRICRTSHGCTLTRGRAALYSEALDLINPLEELRRDLGQLLDLRSTKFETEDFIVELIRRVLQKHDLVVGIFPADQT